MAIRTKTRRSRLSPRKTPRQERSRATVEAILEAATDILVRHGYATLTTNRVAERAGVNIASLYQYFPSKEAIVAELRKRHVAEQRAAAAQALTEHRGKGLEAAIQALVSTGLAVHAVAPALHQAFTEQLPDRRSRMTAPDEAPMADVRRLLEQAAVDLPDKELALWMIDTVAHAVIHRAAVERPKDLSSELLASELSALLLRYLRRK
jgi:AcrR family transcriptional regulator